MTKNRRNARFENIEPKPSDLSEKNVYVVVTILTQEAIDKIISENPSVKIDCKKHGYRLEIPEREVRHMKRKHGRGNLYEGETVVKFEVEYPEISEEL